MTDRRIKCRWCNYSVPPFYTTKAGKKGSGWVRLRHHQEDEHPDERAEICDPDIEAEEEVEQYR